MTAETRPASLESSYYGMWNLYFESSTVFMFPAFSLLFLFILSLSDLVKNPLENSNLPQIF